MLSSFLFTADPLFAEKKTENVTMEAVRALEQRILWSNPPLSLRIACDRRSNFPFRKESIPFTLDDAKNADWNHLTFIRHD
jgi:hypothetical protein